MLCQWRSMRRPALVMALAWLALLEPGGAATLTADGFSYEGGSPAFQRPGGGLSPVFAFSNPRPGAANGTVYAEGAHVSFYGSSAACPDAVNGAAGPLGPRQAAALYAIPGAGRPPAGATVFSPLPDAVSCPGAGGSAPGPAYVAADGAGLHLLTAALPPQSGRGAFFGQYGTAGEVDKGTNASIENAQVVWIFDWKHGDAIHAWGPGRTGPVSLSADMSIDTLRIPPNPPDGNPNQATEQYVVNFLNPQCQAQMADKRYCQVRFSFTAGLARAPGVNWATLPWSRYAKLMFDRAQARLAVIIGPLGDAGAVTVTPGGDPVALWRSAGAASSHGAFGMRHFAAEISFPQFLAALRLVADRAGAGTDAATLDSLFGATGRDPAGWVINSVIVSQEIHTADPIAPLVIAGTIGAVRISAAR